MNVHRPMIRASRQCPVCAEIKSRGSLVCRPCHYTLDLRHGESLLIQMAFDEIENELDEHYQATIAMAVAS